MSCCPPNAEKYLAADYVTAGRIVTLPSNLKVYTSGDATNSHKAVIIISDIFGWNSGRTRSIADLFAAHNYLAVVPQLMAPGLEGGTDGDGLPPGFDTTADRERLTTFITGYDWKGNLDQKLADVVAYVQGEGASQIFGVGFCWGSWVLAHALTDSVGQHFVCAAFGHPSVSLETRAFHRDTETVFQNIHKPVLLMNAKGDNTEYYSDGPWFLSLHTNHPTSESHNYLNVNHGFIPRGDLAVPEVKTAVDSALHRIFEFFDKH